MNYLQRLLRRALLEAPQSAGQILTDPFENERSLTVDYPVTEAGQQAKPAARAALQSSAAGLETPSMVNKAEGLDLRMPVADSALPPQRFSVDSTLQPSMDADRGNQHPFDIPGSIKHMPTADQNMNTTALAQADAFMRALGLPMPAEEAGIESARLAEAAALHMTQPVMPAASENTVRPNSPEIQSQTTRTRAKAQTILPDIELQPFNPQSARNPAEPSRRASKIEVESVARDSYSAANLRGNSTLQPAQPAIRVIAVRGEDKNSAAAWMAEAARFGIGQL